MIRAPMTARGQSGAGDAPAGVDRLPKNRACPAPDRPRGVLWAQIIPVPADFILQSEAKLTSKKLRFLSGIFVLDGRAPFNVET